MKIQLFLFTTILIVSCRAAKSDETTITNETWSMTNFVKVDSVNPILKPTKNLAFNCPIQGKKIQWEGKNVLNPAAFIKDDKVYLLYRAQDDNMTSRLGLAISEDGLHFEKQADPIFYPANDSMKTYEWQGGVEDPRIVESEDGRYILTYTAYDGKTARLCLASSTDLKNWTKQKWRTKSGKPSSKTGERYLPSAAIKALSPKEYAATTAAKRKGTKAGKQHVKQPKKIRAKTKRYR